MWQGKSVDSKTCENNLVFRIDENIKYYNTEIYHTVLTRVRGHLEKQFDPWWGETGILSTDHTVFIKWQFIAEIFDSLVEHGKGLVWLRFQLGASPGCGYRLKFSDEATAVFIKLKYA